METAIIHRSPDGTAQTVTAQNRTYNIVAKPLRWFERRAWWEDKNLRLPRGTGRGIVDREVMRLEVRLGANPRSQISTFELVKADTGETWLLRDIPRAA